MKVLVDGQLIEYKDEGKGKVVVLLHGWGMNLGTYDALAADLSSKFRVVRLDFPGFGGSPKPDDSWGVGEYAQLTAGFLQKLKITNVSTLIGHSFGGRVIIKGISSGSLKSDKVVLMGSAGVKPKDAVRKQVFKVIAKTGKVATKLPGLKKLRPFLQEKLYAAAGSTDYLRAEKLQKIFVNTVNEDLLPNVSSITQKTLMIWGETDDQTPVADAEKMKEKLKDASLIVVPDAGHFVYSDAYPLVIKELRKFL